MVEAVARAIANVEDSVHPFEDASAEEAAIIAIKMIRKKIETVEPPLLSQDSKYGWNQCMKAILTELDK